MQSAINESITKAEILERVFANLIKSGSAFAVWRKPNSQFLEVIHNPSHKVSKVQLDLEDLGSGFIAHPFADQVNQEAYFIPAETYLKISLDENQNYPQEYSSTGLLESEEGQKARIKDFFKKLPKVNRGTAEEDGQSKDHYKEMVSLGIQGILEGKFEKVVPSRTKWIELDSDFDFVKSFEALLTKYPTAFVNFFHLPGVGTWLGASPEVLIETKEDHFFTMSLAGTQPANGENPIKSVAWTQKEIEEQALVSRYIVDCFKKIRLREYEEHGPKTVQAGSLLHLRSDFKVDMKATNFPQLGSVMLKLLHPTSAVCGMPRTEALEFLEKYESFDRSFFAGFMGPVNVESETSIFVNLRTASLHGDYARVYAGAGVTEDSDPEKEWEETEMKCANIGRILLNPDL